MNRTEEMPESETSYSTSRVSPESSSNSSTTTSFFNSASGPDSSSSDSTNPFNLTSLLLFILIMLIIFSYFGLNLLTILGNSFQHFNDITAPFVKQFLAAVGYSTGEVINKSADVTADAAKLGIDVAEGTVQDIGNLFKKGASELDSSESSPEGEPSPEDVGEGEPSPEDVGEDDPSLDQTINTMSEPSQKPNEVQPDSSENPIQKPITADKLNWCLIGEYENKRGCVAVNDSDKCLSGQIFPSQQLCLNPTFTP